MLASIYDWLVSADPPSSADLIFVLAGQQDRKEYAVKLFERGLAPQVLISVGRYEIRRFAALLLPHKMDLLRAIENVPPLLRHFFVAFCGKQFEVRRIPVRAFGTLGEIEALGDWLDARPRITSVLIVSSGFHLRRVRYCCRALLARNLKFQLRAVHEENPRFISQDWWRKEQSRKMILIELVKIICYSVLLPFWKLGVRWRTKPQQPIIAGTDPQ
jgi:hypothetical protein